jgi:23S rRNA pseudouridine1911/1915/1917 synthase
MNSNPNQPNDMREITVPNNLPHQRIDKFLASFPDLGLTRSRIHALLEKGFITINGEAVSKKLELSGGERIQLIVPMPVEHNITPENIPLAIVFEDDYLLVINKPAGLVTHPAPGNYGGTLVHALLYHLKVRPDCGPADRPGLVHRLDKDTTGLLVVAKTEEAFTALQAAMQKREITRIYSALVCGHLKETEGTIESLIGRSRTDRTKMAVLKFGGREAVTKYRVIDRYRSYDLIDVSLVTGRTHQIRVHLSHLGHPVLGDHEYSGRLSWHRGLFAPERPLGKLLLSQINRQALHAKTLRLIHPITRKELQFEAPLPDDFSRILEILNDKGR